MEYRHTSMVRKEGRGEEECLHVCACACVCVYLCVCDNLTYILRNLLGCDGRKHSKQPMLKRGQEVTSVDHIRDGDSLARTAAPG